MSNYYTKQGFALIQDDSAAEGHWFGGKPYHKGAMCPVCKVPLLLIADLASAPFRAIENARLFSDLDRLPLYYCWRCCADHLSYRVVKPDKVEVLRNEGSPQGDDFPYKDFPEQFPRKPVRLVTIQYETAKLLALSQEIGDDWLSNADRHSITEQLRVLRHDGFSARDINRHQIGGLLGSIQGHERVGCPEFNFESQQK